MRKDGGKKRVAKRVAFLPPFLPPSNPKYCPLWCFLFLEGGIFWGGVAQRFIISCGFKLATLFFAKRVAATLFVFSRKKGWRHTFATLFAPIVSVFSRWWQKVWLPPSKKPPFLPPSRPHKRWPETDTRTHHQSSL